MNPLETDPRLFANNKFRVQDEDGRIYDFGAHNLSYYTGEWNKLTLIARPISSITDEEMRQFPNLSDSSTKEMIDWYRESLKDYSGVGISSKDFLRLLEIGCYPFDNSDFGDTVIDTRTLTNA